MKVPVYSKENKKIETLDLPEGFLDVRFNSALIHQAVVAERANMRRPWSHTKGRGDVSGGGRKPWRQKHTGRARVGSTRSPIWVKGGVALGPTNERSYEQKINRKMKRMAFLSLLSRKFKDGDLKVIDSMEIENGKTKIASRLLGLLCDGKRVSSLLVFRAKNELGFRAFRNINNVDSVTAQSISIYDIARKKSVFFEKDAVMELIKKYKKDE